MSHLFFFLSQMSRVPAKRALLALSAVLSPIPPGARHIMRSVMSQRAASLTLSASPAPPPSSFPPLASCGSCDSLLSELFGSFFCRARERTNAVPCEVKHSLLVIMFREQKGGGPRAVLFPRRVLGNHQSLPISAVSFPSFLSSSSSSSSIKDPSALVVCYELGSQHRQLACGVTAANKEFTSSLASSLSPSPLATRCVTIRTSFPCSRSRGSSREPVKARMKALEQRLAPLSYL